MSIPESPVSSRLLTKNVWCSTDGKYACFEIMTSDFGLLCKYEFVHSGLEYVTHYHCKTYRSSAVEYGVMVRTSNPVATAIYIWNLAESVYTKSKIAINAHHIATILDFELTKNGSTLGR